MRTRVGALIATFVIAGVATTAFGGVATGGTNGHSLPPLVIVPTEVAPGGTFTVSGTDCLNLTDAGADVEAAAVEPIVTLSVAFSPTAFGPIGVPAPSGSWEYTVTVPEGTQPGPYSVVAVCDDMLVATGVGAAATEAYPNGSVTVSAVAAQAVPAQPRTAG